MRLCLSSLPLVVLAPGSPSHMVGWWSRGAETSSVGRCAGVLTGILPAAEFSLNKPSPPRGTTWDTNTHTHTHPPRLPSPASRFHLTCAQARPRPQGSACPDSPLLSHTSEGGQTDKGTRVNKYKFTQPLLFSGRNASFSQMKEVILLSKSSLG